MTAPVFAASELAQRFDLELRGDDRAVHGVGTLSGATRDQLSFLANPRYRAQLADTAAGVVEFDSDQEGAAILGGDAGAIIQYSGNALKADDPKQTKVPGKLDFGVVPKQVKAISQMGIFIAGVPKSAPNKANAIAFLKWYTSPETQKALAEAGSIPVKRSGFAAEKPGNRLIPVALKQLDAGSLPRPRTPDWAKVEELLGIQLNKALQAGSGGGAALDTAAGQVKDYLTQAGYYK